VQRMERREENSGSQIAVLHGLCLRASAYHTV
jgi:hypothetical protein